MKKQIQRVSLLQNAKVIAALYLVLALPVMALLLAFGSLVHGATMSVAMMVAFVVAYVLTVFLSAVIGGWLYNFVAAQVGGFEFTTVEVNER
jgi:lipopolysaccharide export LptBFGC system permease protein LptF